jgi:hypothetical protein
MCLTVIVSVDAPATVRTATGAVALDRLLPDTPDVRTTLDAAGALTRKFAIAPAEAMTGVEEQIAATKRARAALQSVLDGAVDGAPGRQRALDALYELREDGRALCAVIGLTAAALQAVKPMPG